MKKAYELKDKSELLVADGAGTLFDPGSVLPVYSFQGSFNKVCDIEVEFSTVMKYIGMDKFQHIKNLLYEQEVLEQFVDNFNRQPTDEDAEALYRGFKEQLYPSAVKTEEIPGVKKAAYELKEANIPLVMTTGYDRTMVNEIIKKLPWLDDVLLDSFTSSDVKKGRPAPYLIYHAMESAGIEDVSRVVKTGDTKVDIEASDNTCMPGVIVLSGNIKSKEDAEKINKMLDRKHLVVKSFVEVVNYVLDGTLGDKIRDLNLGGVI